MKATDFAEKESLSQRLEKHKVALKEAETRYEKASHAAADADGAAQSAKDREDKLQEEFKKLMEDAKL